MCGHSLRVPCICCFIIVDYSCVIVQLWDNQPMVVSAEQTEWSRHIQCAQSCKSEPQAVNESLKIGARCGMNITAR